MTEDNKFVILVVAVAGVLIWAGVNVGILIGEERACESVKMEWVKDRCMRVTREEVK